MRKLPWRAGTRHAAALSAARRQPVDPDGLGCQRDPDGAQWRLSAGDGGKSDAIRHAAVRAPDVRRRGRGRRDLHPHLLGQSRRSRLGATGPCTSRRHAALRGLLINSPPPQSSTLGSEEERVDAIVRSGPGGAIAVAGIATAIVIALWFAFYLLVFLPRSA